MKIALIDVNFGSSSTGKIVSDLLAGLSANGHDAYVFFGRGNSSELPNAVRISSPGEVALHALGTRITGFTDGFSPLATRRLIKELESLQPDVVHLHDVHGYFVNIESLCEYLRGRNIATIWTFHSDFMFTGRCGTANECELWKSGCRNCPDLSRYPKTLFFDFAARMYAGKRELFTDFSRLQLTAPSHWLKSRMRASFLSDKPIHVVPNGLNTRVFRPRAVQSLRLEMGLDNKYCVITVGADLLSKPKGGRWIVELAARFKDFELVFIMVGVERIPKAIPANVMMFPRIFDQNRLSELYSLGDVMLLPSENESFSMVTAEALACGLPVIGFDSGAPKEVAPEGYGSFVPYGDLDALEALLLSVLSGIKKFKTEAECVEFAVSNYSLKAMVLAYEAIYKQAIKIL